MGLPPGERNRQPLRRPQVSSLGHVDEPSLMDDTASESPSSQAVFMNAGTSYRAIRCRTSAWNWR